MIEKITKTLELELAKAKFQDTNNKRFIQTSRILLVEGNVYLVEKTIV